MLIQDINKIMNDQQSKIIQEIKTGNLKKSAGKFSVLSLISWQTASLFIYF